MPVDSRKSNSPWLIRPKLLDAELAGLVGPSDYVVQSRVLLRRQRRLLAANPGSCARRLAGGEHGQKSKGTLPSVQRTIEPDLLYPLLRWSDVSRCATPSCYLLLAHNPARRMGYPTVW